MPANLMLIAYFGPISFTVICFKLLQFYIQNV
jgi:hypothetical protein